MPYYLAEINNAHMSIVWAPSKIAAQMRVVRGVRNADASSVEVRDLTVKDIEWIEGIGGNIPSAARRQVEEARDLFSG